jgi:hypothetical protein
MITIIVIIIMIILILTGAIAVKRKSVVTQLFAIFYHLLPCLTDGKHTI